MALTGFVFGVVAKAVADLAATSEGLRKHVESTTTAGVDITSAEGYLAIVFVFLAVALSLYAASHATAAREEEASGRLDTVLAEPVGRRRWLAGRVVAGAACCVAVALVTALAAWAGAALKAAGVSLPDMLEASLNMLPVVGLFLGLGLAAAAFAPRHTGAVAFGAVGGAYLWEQTGALVKAPDWTLAISPFHWLALVPSESFDATASAVMLAIGAAAAIAAIERFRRRDLVSA
jgi:ABC-2 type transport system permease protein